MPNKLIGTLIALFFFGSSFIIFPYHADAQLSELSEIQDGTFHLSHKNTIFTPYTFSNDKYIDDDQAKFFANASRTEPYAPADDNYPFSLVDNYVLDTDMEIEYQYDKVLCSAYPKVAYLSRHNISISDYTNQKIPPTVISNIVTGVEPFHGDKVTAITWKFNNYESEQDIFIHNYAFTECDLDGYQINTTVRIIRGIVAVWSGETHFHNYLCTNNNNGSKHTYWGASLPWGNFNSNTDDHKKTSQIKNYPDSLKAELFK